MKQRRENGAGRLALPRKVSLVRLHVMSSRDVMAVRPAWHTEHERRSAVRFCVMRCCRVGLSLTGSGTPGVEYNHYNFECKPFLQELTRFLILNTAL